MANGLDLYLSSQLICIMGFGFPTMGSPLPEDLVALTLVFTNSSLPLTTSLPSLLMWLPPFFSFSLQPPPYFSLYFPIYSLRWMAVLWLFLVISGNGGPILSFLSGCSIGSGGNGSDIPQGNTGQPRPGYSKQSHSRPSCSWSREAELGLKVCLGQDYRSNGHWVWHCGTRLGPMA